MSEELIDQALSMSRAPLTGVDVLIVGAGLAGLGFAIEAYRKGHNVKVLERRPDTNDYGMPSLLNGYVKTLCLTSFEGTLLQFKLPPFIPPKVGQVSWSIARNFTLERLLIFAHMMEEPSAR